MVIFPYFVPQHSSADLISFIQQNIQIEISGNTDHTFLTSSCLDGDALLPNTDCDPLRVHCGRVEGEPLCARESPDQREVSIEIVDQSKPVFVHT